MSRKATDARVLAIEGGNGLLDVHMEAPDIEIETRFVTRRCTPKEAGLFLCGYGSWQHRHLLEQVWISKEGFVLGEMKPRGRSR